MEDAGRIEGDSGKKLLWMRFEDDGDDVPNPAVIYIGRPGELPDDDSVVAWVDDGMSSEEQERYAVLFTSAPDVAAERDRIRAEVERLREAVRSAFEAINFNGIGDSGDRETLGTIYDILNGVIGKPSED